MSKKSLKTVALAATASMVLLSTANCFAATVSTKTEYNLNADTVKVTTTVTNMAKDGMVTYLLTKNSDAITSENASTNILYIEQKNSADNGVSFDYVVPNSKFVDGLTSALKMGSNVSEDFLSVDQVRYAAVNVTGADNADVSITRDGVTLPSDKILGKGETATLTVAPRSGYTVKSITVDGTAVTSPATITGTGAEMNIVVTTEAVSSEPTITTVYANTSDSDFTSATARFVAKVSANEKNVKYGAILKHNNEEQKIYALQSDGVDASGNVEAYYAMAFNVDKNGFTDEEYGDYTVTPFVEVDERVVAKGTDVTFRVDKQ